MRRLLLGFTTLTLATMPSLVGATLPPSRICGPETRVTPVDAEAGILRISSPTGGRTARWAPARPAAKAQTGQIVTIFARAFYFDADNNVSDTERDTVIVAPGTTIRFQLAAGEHTVTNGFDSGDPTAGQKFDYLLDTAHPIWDTTLTVPTQFDYFCYFHEPVMGGTIIVRQNLDVPGGAPSGRATFSRLPAPNPARGTVDFAITLPRSASVQLEVLDLAGRRQRTLQSGSLTGGEHAFHWDGRTDRGGSVSSGRYQIRFTADGVSQTRAVTMLR